jgi:predicted HAD superfamily Cof-like phosphohydrolase
MNGMSLVREFHQKFSVANPAYPSPPEVAQIRARIALIREEFREVMKELDILSRQTSANARMEEKLATLGRLLKELADLRYVTEGTAVAFGLDIDGAFVEVHRSNMSKLGADGKPITNSAGKVLKGPNYSEADMTMFVQPVVEAVEIEIEV